MIPTMRTRLGAVSLIVAAPLLLAADLVRSDHSGRAAVQFAQVSADRGRELLSAGLFLVGAALLALAAFGLAGLVTGRGARLAGAGTALLGLAALWLAAGRSVFAFLLYAAAAPGPRHAAAEHIFVSITSSGGFAIYLPLLLTMAAAPFLLALGLRRARLAPLWPAPVWLVGVVAYFAVEGNKVGELVTFGPMMAALAGVGVAIARSTTRTGWLPRAELDAA